MATRGKYLINPVPYIAIVANPRRSKKKVARRNPMKKRRKKAGIFVIRKATRNPIKKKKRHAKKRAASKFLPAITKNPMKTKRRRSRRKASYKRNPARRSRRRRSSRRMRNPIRIINDVFNPNMLTLAGGVVIGNVGTTMIINRLVAPPAGSTRPFDLPFIDYTVPAAQFYTKNAWQLALYKLAIGVGVGYLLRNQSPRLSQGLMIGSVAGAISDVLKQSGVITPAGTIAGVGRNFNARGVGFIPGTSTRFTGPAQNFLMNNVPRPRVGAAVRSGFTQRTATNAENAFSAAN